MKALRFSSPLQPLRNDWSWPFEISYGGRLSTNQYMRYEIIVYVNSYECDDAKFKFISHLAYTDMYISKKFLAKCS
jgi:hypothetical protein